MKLNVDAYLARRFHLARQNCWHLVRDAWLELTGDDLGDRTPERITAATLTGKFDTDVPAFRRLDGPQDPSIVLMRSPGVVPHVGIYHQRRVLQMTQRGASFVPLASATVGYSDVGFYR